MCINIFIIAIIVLVILLPTFCIDATNKTATIDAYSHWTYYWCFLFLNLFKSNELYFSLATWQRRQPHFPILINFPISQSPLWSPDQHNIRCLISAGPSDLPQTAAQQLTSIPVNNLIEKIGLWSVRLTTCTV